MIRRSRRIQHTEKQAAIINNTLKHSKSSPRRYRQFYITGSVRAQISPLLSMTTMVIATASSLATPSASAADGITRSPAMNARGHTTHYHQRLGLPFSLITLLSRCCTSFLPLSTTILFRWPAVARHAELEADISYEFTLSAMTGVDGAGGARHHRRVMPTFE